MHFDRTPIICDVLVDCLYVHPGQQSNSNVFIQRINLLDCTKWPVQQSVPQLRLWWCVVHDIHWCQMKKQRTKPWHQAMTLGIIHLKGVSSLLPLEFSLFESFYLIFSYHSLVSQVWTSSYFHPCTNSSGLFFLSFLVWNIFYI